MGAGMVGRAEPVGPVGPMPWRLRLIVGLLVVQGLANAVVGYAIVAAVDSDLSHGRSVDGAGLLRVLGYGSIVVGIVLVACAVLLTRRLNWARGTVIGIEVLSVAGGLAGVLQGQPGGVSSIGIGVGVLSVLLNQDVARWFARGA